MVFVQAIALKLQRDYTNMCLLWRRKKKEWCRYLSLEEIPPSLNPGLKPGIMHLYTKYPNNVSFLFSSVNCI